MKKIFSSIHKRYKESRKYDFGSLLIIGGSKVYSGSPAFNALAALRAGVDIVEITAPKRSADIIATFSPDLITHPLSGDYFNSSHLNELNKIAGNKTACVIGGGLGREKETSKAVQMFLKKTELPCVVDADGIHAIVKKKDVLKNNFVLTPHSQEFYVLSGEKLEKEMEKKKKQVKKIAKKLGVVILLKGGTDIISDGNQSYLNKTGTPYMTKGGTGDTLAGIIGSLLAQGVKPLEAACFGAYVNGKAGELAAEKFEEGVLASDLIRDVPKAINL